VSLPPSNVLHVMIASAEHTLLIYIGPGKVDLLEAWMLLVFHLSLCQTAVACEGFLLHRQLTAHYHRSTRFIFPSDTYAAE
jgi:hypothetical protein